MSSMFAVFCITACGNQTTKQNEAHLILPKNKVQLRCGVSQGVPGFSNADASEEIGLV